jgi:hypothetical protein
MTVRRFAFVSILAFATVSSGGAWAGGGAGATPGGASASTVASGAGSTSPGSTSGTVGSAGSASAGDTSASSLGLGASSTTPTQSSNSIAVGGSAAAPDGRTISRNRVHDGKNGDFGRSADTAIEPGGTWSRSVTRTFDRNDTLHSRTRSMSHTPGSPVERSTSGSTVQLGQ